MKELRVVYVVDDDHAVGEALTHLLAKNGFDVEHFESAAEFLAKVNPAFPGCLLTDLRMPDMDGLHLQEQLLRSHSCLSVVFITGNATIGETVKIMSRGAMTLLEKPCRNDELVSVVDEAIDNSLERYRQIQRQQSAAVRLAQLDEDELVALDLASQGITSKAICNRLSISPRTLDRRRHSALRKLNIATVAEFVRLKVDANVRTG